jgi:hypothetical protein
MAMERVCLAGLERNWRRHVEGLTRLIDLWLGRALQWLVRPRCSRNKVNPAFSYRFAPENRYEVSPHVSVRKALLNSILPSGYEQCV